MDTKKIANNLFKEIRKLKLVNKKVGGNIMSVKEADRILKLRDDLKEQYKNAGLRKKEKLFVPELKSTVNVVNKDIQKHSVEEADRILKLRDDLKEEYKNAALRNIYVEEEKEKSFGPVTNELKNIVNAVNEVKEINIKTDEDIKKVLVPYKRPEVLQLTNEVKTPIKSPLMIRSPIIKNMSPAQKNTIVLGPNTSKYLPRIKDSVFGLYYNALNKQYMIGKDVVEFKDDNLVINGKTYEGTTGLFNLLCYSAYATPNHYTERDFDNYKDILIQTDSMYQNNDKSSGNVKSSKGEKYLKMIKPIWHSLPENVNKRKKLAKENDETEKEGDGLKDYSEDRIEYKYIHNLNELLKRLYFIASEEKAGNNNFDNEKIGIVHFFTSELEKLAVTPKGIEFLISYVSSLPEKIVEGSGLMNRFLNSNFMPEIHWPGYNYLGPFTDLEKNRKPVNKLDKAAMEHDYFYKEHKDIKTRHIGDKILEDKAWDRFLDPDASLGEKTAALITANTMKAKQYFGMGMI